METWRTLWASSQKGKLSLSNCSITSVYSNPPRSREVPRRPSTRLGAANHFGRDPIAIVCSAPAQPRLFIATPCRLSGDGADGNTVVWLMEIRGSLTDLP